MTQFAVTVRETRSNGRTRDVLRVVNARNPARAIALVKRTLNPARQIVAGVRTDTPGYNVSDYLSGR